jgi:hypothetical protein
MKKMGEIQLTICAFRYALGRTTYVTAEMSDHIIAGWNQWPEFFREQVCCDILHMKKWPPSDEFKASDCWNAVLKNAEVNDNFLYQKCRVKEGFLD